MTYFQNPFSSEFRGNWVLGDRQHSLTFVCPGNSGRSEEIVSSWNEPTNGVYDLSGDDADENSANILTFRFSINQIWTNLEVDLTDNSNASLSPAPTDSSMKPYEIVSILNSHPSFSSYFVASLGKFDSTGEDHRIIIKQKFPTSRMKYFILNGRGEEVLRFNKRAGVAELPSYFKRYKVYGGDMTYPMDGTNVIVELDPDAAGGSSVVDDNIINHAVDNKGNPLGFNASVMKEDYELLAGRASGLFTFQKLTVDGSDRITQIIEYPAGAVVGDLARKIKYTYTGSNLNPTAVTEIPYVLAESDLVNP
jgi:hypothetical protein